MSIETTEPRVTVAFAMFCEGYDPEQPTDLRRMTTGVEGWTPDDPPTLALTLAVGLWSAGGAGRLACRVGIRRPGEDISYLGEGETSVEGPGELAIMPLKMTLTFTMPGAYWAICEIAGQPVVEVPFTVSERRDAPGTGRAEAES